MGSVQPAGVSEGLPPCGLADPNLKTTVGGVATDRLSVARWSRYGRTRLYVSTPDGTQVGWADPITGERSLAMPELATAFEAALADAEPDAPEPLRAESPAGSDAYVPRRAIGAVAAAQPAPGDFATDLPARPAAAPIVAPAVLPQTPCDPGEWFDLATNVPGQGARARARAELAAMRRREAAFATFLPRGLDAKTDERSWGVGTSGEEAVGAGLDDLRRDGWFVLHSVPVGTRGSDIDHVVIGPGGVHTVNTKTHPNANVWIGRTTVLVNGHSQPYLRNSRFEADRASAVLSAAVGWPVEVTPALVFLTGTVTAQVTVKEPPDGVVILDGLDLPGYFRTRDPQLGADQVQLLFEHARRSSTWA